MSETTSTYLEQEPPVLTPEIESQSELIQHIGEYAAAVVAHRADHLQNVAA